ncbi:hypothetical protein SAMN06297280_0936 [Arsukibacterium tuosuense]|uniref:Uncharacterized protein n=1 Tax=Arsukibacterium tuosuense TaxID=1323745 RepID=A0A285ICD9_9GAMM|nr:hypothetical protein [Arsukibacterium tuosuense]SNY45674.1 hypothetical protein SAMN06297280_0936 [Arsukibacterium tuosuense]
MAFLAFTHELTDLNLAYYGQHRLTRLACHSQCIVGCDQHG